MGRSPLSPYNRFAIGVAIFTFLFELYYSVCYILERYIKVFGEDYDILNDTRPYPTFRFLNVYYIDMVRNFWTAMVILYLFNQITRYKQTMQNTPRDINSLLSLSAEIDSTTGNSVRYDKRSYQPYSEDKVLVIGHPSSVGAKNAHPTFPSNDDNSLRFWK